MFFPVADTFTYSENLLGLLPISGPVQWLSGNPILAYNVTFLLSFPLSGLSAYLLGRELTGRHDAAWVAGLIYGFAPYRVDHLPQVQVLAWYWVPVILLALHRFVRDGRTRWLVLLGVAYLLQGLSNGYLFLFVPVLVGLWTLWFVPLVRQWRAAASIALAGAIAGLAALPILLKYETVHQQFGFERSLGEMSSFSADLTAILSAPEHLALWGWMGELQAPEGQLFPGLTVICLLAFAVARLPWPPTGTPPRWVTRLRRLFATLSALFLLVVLTRFVGGPWEIAALNISVNQLDKPFSLALLFLAAWVVSSPVVLTAHARRSVLGFYLLAIVALWILTWGPFPTIAGQPVIERGPYSWLTVIPGFDGLRVPARFWILATACLSAACGLVLARAVASGSRRRYAVVAVVACGVIADGWIADMPIVESPRLSASLDGHDAGAVLELPLGNPYDDLEAMYRSMFHERPVVNGYSGQLPPHYPELGRGLADGDGEVLAQLARLGVRDVLVIRERDTDGRAARFLSSYPGARQIAETPDEILYRLSIDSLEVPPEAATGAALPIASLSANVNGDIVGNALDGDLTSRWETGPQQPGHELVIDLGTSQAIGAIRLALGSFVADAPRLLQIEVSDGGVEWTQVWQGPTRTSTIVAALRDPSGLVLEFPYDRCRGRFVRLRQLGEDPVYYWSVAELSVLGPDVRATRPVRP